MIDCLMKEFPAFFFSRREESILEGFVSQVFLKNDAQFSIQGDDFRNWKTDLAQKMVNLLIGEGIRVKRLRLGGENNSLSRWALVSKILAL